MANKIDKKNKTSNKKILNNSKKDDMLKNENYFSLIEVSILLAMSIIVSLVVGSLITYNFNKQKQYKNDENMEKFIKNYEYIVNNYYEDVDKEVLINGAIKGMISTLDDEYSYVIEGTESDNFNILLEGEYEGLGVEIVNIEDKVVVYNIFEDSPAADAGLKIGDIIKKVDEMECTGKSTSDVSKYIRNTKKEQFSIIIERDEEEKELTINKRRVVIKSVVSKTYEKNNKKIGYIYFNIFSNSAIKQFERELNKLENDNIDGLIIDVRDNSGGHLVTATRIISLFLDNKHIIYQTNTKGDIKKYYSTGSKTKKYPIVVLQNSNTASASEMLSAALKEEYGATIVGEKSYGKGTVQELSTLDNDIEYKITTREWLTPKGNSINKKGIKVDVEVSLSEEYLNEPTEENDNQLQKAVEILSEK